MIIRLLFFCALSTFTLEGMNKTHTRSKTGHAPFEKRHIETCKNILSLLKTAQEEVEVNEACVHIESLMAELNDHAAFLIMVFNRCGIVDGLKRYANKGHPYASYLACYLFEDKRKNERLIYQYLTVASKMFPRAAIWLLSCETDAQKILEAIDRCQQYFHTLTERQRTQVFAKLRIMVAQNQRGALRRFIKWSMSSSERKAELAELLSGRARNGLTSDIDLVIDSMYQELRSYGEKHPEVAYCLGQIFEKRSKSKAPDAQKWRAQAEELCRSAHRQEYLPAQWRLFTVDTSHVAGDAPSAGIKDLVARTRRFLSEHSRDSLDVKALTTELRSAIKVLEKDAATFEQLEALAEIYREGIQRVVDKNESRAHTLLKAAYTIHFQGMQGRALVEACVQEFERVEALPYASDRRTALVKFLVDEAVIRNNLEALSLLCRLYAFGLYGMEPSVLELVNVCITTHMVMQRKHPDERNMFLQETGLKKLLDMPLDGQRHHPANYFVLGLIWGSSCTIEQAEQERYTTILSELEDQYRNDEDYTSLLYRIGPLENLPTYLVRQSKDFETACLAANLVIARSHHSGNLEQSSIPFKVLNIILHTLSLMIRRACASVKLSCIPSSTQAELLRQNLRELIEKESAEGRSLAQVLLRNYAFLELFIENDLLSSGFCSGVSLLGQIAATDTLSREVLSSLQYYLLFDLRSSPDMEVPVKKLRYFFSLIFVEIHMLSDYENAAEHFRQCLYYVRQQNIRDYESWSEIHDPADLFDRMLEIPSPNHIALSIRLRFHLYLSAHYAFIARITSDEEKAAALLKKSRLYLEKGKQCYAAAIEIMRLRTLDSVEKKSMVLHSTELLQAAQELAIEDQQFLDEVERTKAQLVAELTAV